MVPRPAALRYRAALWFRTRLRENADVYHRRPEYPRRNPIRAHTWQRRILIRDLRFDRRSWMQNDQRRRFDHDVDFIRGLLVLFLVPPKFGVQMNCRSLPNNP